MAKNPNYKDDLEMEIKRASGLADSLAFQKGLDGQWRVYIIKIALKAQQSVLLNWEVTVGQSWPSVGAAIAYLKTVGYIVT